MPNRKTKIVERRVSVSGDDINDFSKTYHEEQGSFKGSSDPEKAAELFAAVENGDLETVRTLRKVVGANVTDDDGNTPLHKAAEGETECVKLLLGAGGASKALLVRNSNNDTPLMSAIRYEDKEIVELMIGLHHVEGGVPSTAQATDEAIALALKLDLTEILGILTGKDIAEKKMKKPAERRVSELNARNLANTLRAFAT